MKDTNQTQMLLSMARKDMSALQGMRDPEIFAEEIFGFHAQQVAEKALKAWLAWLGIAYRSACGLNDCDSAGSAEKDNQRVDRIN
ncbi:MAG: HEPN domain-containing protein [Mariprofundales bacterium]